MAARPSPRPAPLHSDLLLLDQPGGTVVRRTAAALPGPRRLLLPRRAHHRAGRLDQNLEQQRPALQVDQDRRSDHRPHLPLLLTHLRTGTLASVNHPSPADRGRNIGRWPVTPIQRSRVDNHRVPVRSRSLRDLSRSPSSHPASALVIGRRDRQGALQACLLASRRHPGYLHSLSTSLCTAPYTPDPTSAGVIGARLPCRLSPSGGIRFWRGIGRACRGRSTSWCAATRSARPSSRTIASTPSSWAGSKSPYPMKCSTCHWPSSSESCRTIVVQGKAW